MPSNYERWLSITNGLTSPKNYIEWGGYSLISSCLQRRVWTGPKHMPLFPNMYIILVGRAGLGKGIVIKRVAELLKYHKLPDPSLTKQQAAKAITEADKQLMEEVRRQDYMRAKSVEDGPEKHKESQYRTFEKPALFPTAPDDTTYESLVQVTAKALRRINYEDINQETGAKFMGIYTHSSLSFCLEELSSLMKKHTENVVRYLLVTYDCGDYERDTKHQGKDRVKKCCVNILAGTTPEYMQYIFDSNLIDEGLSSRTHFIYAAQNSKRTMFLPELTPEQEQYKKDLLEHIQKLSELYGNVRVDQSTWEKLDNWWKAVETKRANTSPKLNGFYERLNMHIPKLAMAQHFFESTEMYMPWEAFERAIETSEKEEKRMHYALGLDNNNPLAKPAKMIYQFIAVNGGRTKKELLGEFWEQLPTGEKSLEEILEHLQAMGKILSKPVENPITKDTKIKYVVLEQGRVTV